MTHYADGSSYEYGHSRQTGLVCAGWLGEGHPFQQAEPRVGFLDRLAWRCLNEQHRAYRGIHICEWCPRLDTAQLMSGAGYISILHNGKKRLLGSAEITVESGDKIYAAPNLILHYVAAHGYGPPSDFVDALMSGRRRESLSDWTLFSGPYW